MTVMLSTQLDSLLRERDRLDELLMLDANWRALRQLEAREAAGEPLVAVDGADLKARLLKALGSNRVFAARVELDETIELLSADMPAAPSSGGSLASRITLLVGQAGGTFRTRVRVKGGVIADGEANGAENTAAQPMPEAPRISQSAVDTPVVAAVMADPLELIDGLGRRAVEQLQEGGVTRFADIARWTSADVDGWRLRLVGDAHGTAGSWIEQAAVLATGRLTHFARRARRGEFASLVAMTVQEPVHVSQSMAEAVAELPPVVVVPEAVEPVASPAPDSPTAPDHGYTRPRRRLSEMLADSLADSEVFVVSDAATRETVAKPVTARAARPRTLLERLKALQQPARFEANDYAAYRGRVQEASVTIINSAAAPSDRLAENEAALATTVSEAASPLRRFLKALTGKS